MVQLANVRRKALVALAMCAAAAGAQAQLIVNGGFEDPAFTDRPWHFVYATGTQLTGWSSHATYGGTVLFNGGYMPVAEGNQAVQLEAPGDWIGQSFATVTGANYRLSFDLSAYSYYGGPGLGNTLCPCESIVDVGVGSTWTRFEGSSEGYVTYTLDFTADSSWTTLTFLNPADPAAFGNYPQLDDVSVVQTAEGPSSLRLTAPIPEPETFALVLCGLALLRWRTTRSSPRAQA